jgi:hypothetical protein
MAAPRSLIGCALALALLPTQGRAGEPDDAAAESAPAELRPSFWERVLPGDKTAAAGRRASQLLDRLLAGEARASLGPDVASLVAAWPASVQARIVELRLLWREGDYAAVEQQARQAAAVVGAAGGDTSALVYFEALGRARRGDASGATDLLMRLVSDRPDAPHRALHLAALAECAGAAGRWSLMREAAVAARVTDPQYAPGVAVAAVALALGGDVRTAAEWARMLPPGGGWVPADGWTPLEGFEATADLLQAVGTLDVEAVGALADAVRATPLRPRLGALLRAASRFEQASVEGPLEPPALDGDVARLAATAEQVALVDEAGSIWLGDGRDWRSLARPERSADPPGPGDEEGFCATVVAPARGADWWLSVECALYRVGTSPAGFRVGAGVPLGGGSSTLVDVTGDGYLWAWNAPRMRTEVWAPERMSGSPRSASPSVAEAIGVVATARDARRSLVQGSDGSIVLVSTEPSTSLGPVPLPLGCDAWSLSPNGARVAAWCGSRLEVVDARSGLWLGGWTPEPGAGLAEVEALRTRIAWGSGDVVWVWVEGALWRLELALLTEPG